MDTGPIEKRLGITFRDKNLLLQALTHRSYLNDNRKWPLNHNERFEFLGDAVLELIVSDFLFRKYPNKAEGDLTFYRAALVNTESNAASGASLGLNDFMLMSKGEARSTGRARAVILANALEAIIGALYLDQGYAAAEELVSRLVLSRANDVIGDWLKRDTKSRLQEIAQGRLQVTPSYQVLDQTGPDHDRQFVVGVFFGGDLIAQGSGSSKQRAEEDAARAALESKGWIALT